MKEFSLLSSLEELMEWEVDCSLYRQSVDAREGATFFRHFWYDIEQQYPKNGKVY
jgi:hypothetical protein